MYICICRGITEEKLKQAAKGEHRSKEVLKKLGVGNECGVCILQALDKLQHHQKNKK